ncbi:MAG: hypothetical protein QM820_12320 [Minicystis sp.]
MASEDLGIAEHRRRRHRQGMDEARDAGRLVRQPGAELGHGPDLLGAHQGADPPPSGGPRVLAEVASMHPPEHVHQGGDLALVRILDVDGGPAHR